MHAAERGDASASVRATLERQLGAVDVTSSTYGRAHELRALVSAREAACRDDPMRVPLPNELASAGRVGRVASRYGVERYCVRYASNCE